MHFFNVRHEEPSHEIENVRTLDGKRTWDTASVSRIVTDWCYAPGFWMGYHDHRGIFEWGLGENHLDEHPLAGCVELYCAGPEIDRFSLGSVRDFLMEELDKRLDPLGSAHMFVTWSQMPIRRYRPWSQRLS